MQLELLSPAANYEYGVSAIECGADALYIGFEGFSARKKAGNKLSEIEKLVSYAHQFYAKVYCAYNVVLFESELSQTESHVRQLYEAGVDALIVQDLAFLELDIPPIALHASTQMEISTLKRARFLADSGFSRLVLARELSLTNIATISAALDCEIEAFVHGAVCVSYSGNCYLSAYKGKRSANRGECAQPCRKKYSLYGSDATLLAKEQYLLSLKDIDRSLYLLEMAEAGVGSFKIEGRLKSKSYLKNVTAAYRKALDAILDGSHFQKASSGLSDPGFRADLAKSFNRGHSDYFLHGRREGEQKWVPPKSKGEAIGIVKTSSKGQLALDEIDLLHNGDGLCFERDGELYGAQALVKNRVLCWKGAVVPKKGELIYRNRDLEFEKLLEKKSAVRKIAATVDLLQKEETLLLRATDEDSVICEMEFALGQEPVQDATLFAGAIEKAMKRSGSTIFKVDQVNIVEGLTRFIPASELNRMRRALLAQLLTNRMSSYKQALRKEKRVAQADYTQIDYSYNVTNSMAKAAYKKSGADKVEDGFELLADAKRDEKALMRCKYCLKHSLGRCKHSTDEYWVLVDTEGSSYRLEFDCRQCQMLLYAE